MSSDRLPGVTAADEAFVAAFHAHQLSNQGFHHRNHLRLAWVQILRIGLDAASEAGTSGIRHFAAHHVSAERCNDTTRRSRVPVLGLGSATRPERPLNELLAA